MKITVLGCGALGKLWLSALVRRGHQVQGWLRVPQSECHVHLITPQGLTDQRRLPANDNALLAQSDLLLVTLKAWQIANALPPLVAPSRAPLHHFAATQWHGRPGRTHATAHATLVTGQHHPCRAP